MKLYHLYLITNIVNKKKYIGITKIGYTKRFQRHIENAHYFYERSQGILLYRAMRKHGFSQFEIQLLAEGKDWSDLCELEIEAIKKYKTYVGDKDSWGYNQTRGGDGCDGYKWTEEQLEAHPRPAQSEEIREKKRQHPNSKPWLGKKLSKEHREKVRKARLGTKRSMESRLKQSRNTKHGKDNHKSKPVIIDGTRYETVCEASEAVGFSQNCVSRRANNPKVSNYIWAKK